MFERFRKTNDAPRETDGSAVAVSSRERDEPATTVAAPSDDPAVRERRLDELHATEAEDPDMRGLDRERVAEHASVAPTAAASRAPTARR